jgi:hypothetical protein
VYRLSDLPRSGRQNAVAATVPLELFALPSQKTQPKLLVQHGEKAQSPSAPCHQWRLSFSAEFAHRSVEALKAGFSMWPYRTVAATAFSFAVNPAHLGCPFIYRDERERSAPERWRPEQLHGRDYTCPLLKRRRQKQTGRKDIRSPQQLECAVLRDQSCRK